jgi:transposase
MFIRQVKKKNAKDGKTFFQYQLVQASRIGGKVKQQALLYLGSEKLLEDPKNRKMVLELLKATIFKEPTLFESYPAQIIKLVETYYEKFKVKYPDHLSSQSISLPPAKKNAKYEEVDTSDLDIEDARTFGGEHLCSQVMGQLHLPGFLKECGFTDNEVAMAMISIIGRALFTSSEHKTSQYLKDNSELQRIYGQGNTQICHRKLYKIADKLYDNKPCIDQFLYDRITDMFSLKDTLVIYDLSNSYFEGRKDDSELARFGRSKEKRNDCKQVIFTGVINAQGFIRYSRIYPGNTPDMNTLEDMVEDLKQYSGTTKDKVVVMDAGFASEENLKWLNKQGLEYVCISRTQLKDYKPAEGGNRHELTDNRGHKISLEIFNPEGHRDTWMCVQSEQKRLKEQSMSEKLCQRFEDAVQALSDGLSKKGTTKKLEKVWERIGRMKESHKMVSSRYDITVVPDQESRNAIKVTFVKKPNKTTQQKEAGKYFIRTNNQDPKGPILWDIYNTIREVEATFRCLKTDLAMRPIHHQKDERVESHLYLAMLAYQLVNTIRHMLKAKGINHDWQNLTRIMSTQTIQSVLLKTETKTISIRKPSRPNKNLLDIYIATESKSMIPAIKESVVYH